MKKKVLLSVLALGAIVSVASLGISLVSANESSSYPPIVSRLAGQFNLNEEDVEAVFDSVHDEKREQMVQSKEDALNQAVADGVITEEQKDALLAKYQEMWEEKSQEKEQHREEMEAWYEEQGIDHEALMEYFRGFGGHRKSGKWGMGKMHFH
jgi:hypothetical protein